MTTVQRLQLKQSEVRSKMGALLDTAVEQRNETYESDVAKTINELRSLEVELQGALLAEPPAEARAVAEDAEGREIRELRGRVEFGDYVRASLSMRPADGAARELNAALNIPENRFPLELLAPERRAAIDGDAQGNQGTWLDRLFDGTAAQRLGISFSPVAPGVAAFPVMTSTAAAAQRARAQAAAGATFTATITEMKPKRSAVHGIYSVEDDARLPGLGDAILRDMSSMRWRRASTKRSSRVTTARPARTPTSSGSRRRASPRRRSRKRTRSSTTRCLSSSLPTSTGSTRAASRTCTWWRAEGSNTIWESPPSR